MSPLARIVLIGDAAHAMTQQAGQGAAMALEDAETLAYTLARSSSNNTTTTTTVAKGHHALARLIHRWKAHRQARLRQVKAFTDKNGRLRSPEASFAMQLAKEWFMWLMFRFVVTVEGMRWLFGYLGEDVVGLLAEE
jgi:2-polyprenyl-6-methoxyphenol hydroxylase-like FAD-dependent oxidoreductase